MLDIIKGWLNRYLYDYDAMSLLFILTLFFFVVLTMGWMLAPVFAAIVLAFIMQGLINWLTRIGLNHLLSVVFVFVVFVMILLIFMFVILPSLWGQVERLVNEVPRMINIGMSLLKKSPEMYPGFISEEHVVAIANAVNNSLGGIGEWVVEFLLSNLPGAIGLLIYLVLVPILTFFFLKDKDKLLNWAEGLLPVQRSLINQVAVEMNEQIINYVRGKAIEIVVVCVISFISFFMLKLNYSALLALLVGLSVIIPYIGAAIVTIPIVIIGFFQWGLSNEFLVMMVVYGIIQMLDGYVLVPLLFAKTVNLHPVAIIIAILVFGGFWGFWGVFFAIPMAALIKAVITALPNKKYAIAS